MLPLLRSKRPPRSNSLDKQLPPNLASSQPRPAQHPQCGQGISTYPWPAESIAEFVKGRTLLSHAPIDRPSFVKSPLFPLFALFVLGAGGVVAWRLYNSPLVRMTWLWALGALAVYGFSTSGGMYNIIRGMPMYYRRPGGKIQWWLEVRGGREAGAGARGRKRLRAGARAGGGELQMCGLAERRWPCAASVVTCADQGLELASGSCSPAADPLHGPDARLPPLPHNTPTHPHNPHKHRAARASLAPRAS